MAITTYSELKTAVANWLKRTDLTSVIPDLVTLAELRISRSLLARAMEAETQLSMTAGSRTVTLPTDFDSAVGLWMKAALPREPLPQRLPETLQVQTNYSGIPQAWAIDNGSIAFDCLASDAWDFDFRYIRSLTLSDSAPTNYILTKYPDVYLFGSLVEAASYTHDDQRSAMWESRFQAAIRDASNEENRNRSGAALTTELCGMGHGSTFNINRGY